MNRVLKWVCAPLIAIAVGLAADAPTAEAGGFGYGIGGYPSLGYGTSFRYGIGYGYGSGFDYRFGNNFGSGYRGGYRSGYRGGVHPALHPHRGGFGHPGYRSGRPAGFDHYRRVPLRSPLDCVPGRFGY